MWTCKKGHLLHKDNTEIHRVHLQSGPAALLSRSPGDHLAGPAPNCDDPSFMGRSSLSEAVLGVNPSSSDTPKYNILLASCIKFYIGMLFCTSQLHIQLYKYINIHIYIYNSIYLIYLPTYLSIYLSIYL